MLLLLLQDTFPEDRDSALGGGAAGSKQQQQQQQHPNYRLQQQVQQMQAQQQQQQGLGQLLTQREDAVRGSKAEEAAVSVSAAAAALSPRASPCGVSSEDLSGAAVAASPSAACILSPGASPASVPSAPSPSPATATSAASGAAAAAAATAGGGVGGGLGTGSCPGVGEALHRLSLFRLETLGIQTPVNPEKTPKDAIRLAEALGPFPPGIRFDKSTFR